MIVTDDFGRKTVFEGESLLEETTDNADGSKPQWLEVDIWRTEGGSFVVRRTTKYRIRHARENCGRAEGYDLVPATEADTYFCPSCNQIGSVRDHHWAQSPRINVDVYPTPEELIEGFADHSGTKFNNLARAILADLSEKDPRVDAAWNTVVVP